MTYYLIFLALIFFPTDTISKSIDYYSGDITINHGGCEWILPKQKFEIFFGKNSLRFVSKYFDENNNIIYPPPPLFAANFHNELKDIVTEQIKNYKKQDYQLYLTKEKSYEIFTELTIQGRKSYMNTTGPFRRVNFKKLSKDNKVPTLTVIGPSEEHWQFMLDHCLKTYREPNKK